MKKRILLVISLMLMLGIGAAAIAYQQSTVTNEATASCCCKGDSCPMKSKDASAGDHKSCCGDDCCKKAGADSCPMMKGEKGHHDKMANHSMDAEKDGCCSCCKSEKTA